MYRNILALQAVLLLTAALSAQSISKKKLDIADMVSWKTIEQLQVSNDGQWVGYVLQPAEGDGQLYLYNTENSQNQVFARAERVRFSPDNRFAVFVIQPPSDTLKAMRRRKVKDPDLPGDTLGIYNLQTQVLTVVPDLMDYQLPKKWSGWLAYRTQAIAQDSTAGKATKKKKRKDIGQLTFLHLADGEEWRVPDVLAYEHAEEGQRFVMTTKHKDSTQLAGVYLFDAEQQDIKPLFQAIGKYPQLAISKQGKRLAFVVDTDTTKAQIRPYRLYHWEEGTARASLLAEAATTMIPDDWIISPDQTLQFAEDGTRLFFGIAPAPIVEDTSMLPEEQVEVEVWTSADSRLYTQQQVLKDKEEKRAYLVAYDYPSERLTRLATLGRPEVKLGDEGKANWVLAYNETPYLPRISWEGFPTYKDIYLVNVLDGTQTTVGEAVKGDPILSPKGEYVYWFSPLDTAWYAYSVARKQTVALTDNTIGTFFDELNDEPQDPDAYGMAAWLENDQALLIYDRYDLWKIDPAGTKVPQRLTDGRAKKRRYRYLKLDSEKRFLLPNERVLLRWFDEHTKGEGYAWLYLDTKKIVPLQSGNYHYTRPTKAKDTEQYVFTRENFQDFPNLYVSKDLRQAKQISTANPQQSDYGWGTIELYEWMDLNGQPLQGMLVKPPDFDPGKKYPLIVNFYERSSDGLHRHRAPEAHRSTINYAFYANRGYLIFNPDVPYRVGYPGESAYNAVMPGITALIAEGFVDQANIGVQGHSWGGYQVAYLLTKTDLFKCAESGAPVVNMISAYGGIRWGTGLSRMFQYERSQSRIGGTLWEYPLRYIENSPIFFTDKINTPVLILHNDKDGAVPWYQGIEWFVALRRLGKPAWMLNYNDEPHWPVKLQNRKDFQKRMAQFFDYYLQGAPQPIWMKEGVSPLEKGIRQGYEAAEEDKH